MVKGLSASAVDEGVQGNRCHRSTALESGGLELLSGARRDAVGLRVEGFG